MKTDTKTSDVQGSLGGKAITMGIRSEDMSQIMGILTNMYKDSLLAILREYACNAIDAHKEAGTDLPIEIFMPTRFNPSLRIRDYGVGMDANVIEQVYAQYGRSTKRDSNNQIGGFGIGCKSALSYTDQFTVTSIKDGYKVVVLVAMDEMGAGEMSILNMPPGADDDWKGEATQEGNGTEVSIAIRSDDTYKLKEHARDFFQYWEPGTVLVDGETPKHFTELVTTLKLSDELYLIEGQSTLSDKIVMGGVPYPANPSITRPTGARGRQANYGIVAFVPIGACVPAPSREELRGDVKRTAETILGELGADGTVVRDGLAQKLRKGLQRVIGLEVAKAKTHAEALQTMLRWRKYDLNGGVGLTFKGDPLPTEWKPTTRAPEHYPGGNVLVDYTNLEEQSYYSDSKSKCRTLGAIDPAEWPDIVWVKGYEPRKFTAAHKDKLIQWCKENGIGFTARTTTGADGKPIQALDGHGNPLYRMDGSVKRFVLLRGNDKPDSAFIDPSRFVAWDTVKAIKVPRAFTTSGGSKRLSGSFDLFTAAGRKTQVPADDISTKNLAWVHGNRYEAERWVAALGAIWPTFTLVHLSENRIGKFKRDFPQAQQVGEVVRAGLEAWIKKQNKLDLQAYTMVRRGRDREYRNLDENKVKDPEIRAAILLAKRDINQFNHAANQMRNLHPHMTSKLDTDYSDPLTEYPLYNRTRPNDPHTYIYLNAVYAARKAGKIS